MSNDQGRPSTAPRLPPIRSPPSRDSPVRIQTAGSSRPSSDFIPPTPSSDEPLDTVDLTNQLSPERPAADEVSGEEPKIGKFIDSDLQ